MATGGGGAAAAPGAGSGPAASGRRGPGLIWAEKKRLNKGTDVVEKRGPYIMSKPPSIQAKLKRQRELAKAALRRQGLLGAPTALKPTPKRSVKFNKGYTALSQTADENLVSLDSDSDGEPGSRCSSGYSSSEASDPGPEPAAAAGRVPPRRGPR
ncbi:protein FAM219B isoform X1 [Oenanthe melanoleuca]|uniref:protein FAM219B isoform X1 n=1 Tax=Oenanthe melanoleuca TaxID=2939378 RepID=UPI0024C1C4AE|nr:protein FAM219B isoform X1 [Oenanthe melanoleuca]